MISAGTNLGPYYILAKLGEGGMGEVYRAKDLRLGREVAIKVLPDQFSKDKEAMSRFEREAKALASLSHPNIITIYDFNVENGTVFAVTELLEGVTLRDYITRSLLSWEKILEVAISISEGLMAAHTNGVIHRDLKPENIFITSLGIVKILDFGLARVNKLVTPEDQDQVSTRWSNETRPGMVMGTIPYMSPEQVRGEFVDARSDIFSFGCVLYEMLTGASPFFSRSMVETMAAILKDHPPELSKSLKGVSNDIDPIIAQCLKKDPSHRFQTAKELNSALKSLLTRLAQGNTQTRDPQRDSGRKTGTRRSRRLIDSIAVLPFINESKNPEAEYLADGITEGIIDSLSQLPKVRVMARSTVFRYKNRAVAPLEIGRELNVRAVLTGNVVERGEMLSIHTELVDINDGAQIWGEHFKRKACDLSSLQEELAEQIFEKLRIKLSGEEKKKIAKRFTDNTEAYHLYLKGRHFWNKRTAEQLKKGIEFFQQAIDIDPNYALAYAGLADCYNILGAYETFPPREIFPKAKAAALRAVELDDTLAEAHTSLALVKHRFDVDWDGAAREFRRAIELNPSYATARHWYSTFLITQGRFAEGLAEIKLAQELDPLSLIINSAVGLAYFYARRYDDALTQLFKTLEMEPNFAPAHLDLLWTYIAKGHQREAITEGQKALALMGEIALAASLGHAFAEGGTQGALRKWLEHMFELSKYRNISPYRISIIYIQLKEYDEAIKWLTKCYEERSNGLLYLKVDPLLDDLREDSRFQEILHKVFK